MSVPSDTIEIVDGASGLPVEARLFVPIEERHLLDTETQWKPWLDTLVASTGQQSSHWSWRAKVVPIRSLLAFKSFAIECSGETHAVIVNPSLTLRALTPDVFEYRLGNRSALEWVIDQYQVKEDARSGIRSDPNRLGDTDDEQYIVRLVGQVVRVSVETVRIVKGLPGEFQG